MKHLLLSTPHDSKAAKPMSQSLSHCEKDEDSQESLQDGSSVSDDTGYGKIGRREMESHLHPSMAQETPDHQHKDFRPLGESQCPLG